MKEGKLYEDLSPLFNRAKTTLLAVQLLFILLAVFFWKLQILEYKKYAKRSEENRIREVILPPQRGLIRDRSGKLLAENIASFQAALIRENCTDMNKCIAEVSGLLGMEAEVLKERIQKYQSLPAFKPIVIKDNLSEEEVARCEVQKADHPELIIQAEPKRYYPQGKFAAHILGYLQEVSPEEIKAGVFPKIHLGGLVGKTGLERTYESRLAGKEGGLLEIVDSLGKYRGELARIPPTAGQDLIISLDSGLQKKAEQILEGREGAIVILDPRNGEVLAMASFPGFDPNKFIDRFTHEEWRRVAENPTYPLQNRAIRGLYSPGSIFKLTMSLAGLDLGLINERTTVTCTGETVIYGHPFACWYKPGHGPVNLFSAIRQSCNIYFYQLGKRMGIQNIARYARGLGFGHVTGIDIPGEKAGLVPDPEWKSRVRKESWYPGETISVSIGQGPILVTPLQVANQTALIARRGVGISAPHILRGETDKYMAPIAIKKDSYEKVIKGMWESANQLGTARAARVAGFDVCGKTGSTQTISRETKERLAGQKVEVKTHSWFTGFAPKDNPRIVITVIVEHGGGGGAAAAPIAGELFAFFKKSESHND